MYTKGRFIGGGGFGEVYVATDNFGVEFALKELKLDAFSHDAALASNITKRFKQEAIKQAEIEHENVIRVHHRALEANPPYFVMELAECTFTKIIEKYIAGEVGFDLIKKGLFDILSGLDALHEIDIWHRDLKPQNVLFLPPDRFAISDFGLIAVRDGQATTLTMTGTTAGSRDYSPPEFMRDFKRADASSDVYSFGSILHDIFVRRPRVPYSELRDGTGKIGDVINRCTKPKQYQRYRSLEELRADLYEAIHEFESAGSADFSKLDLQIFSAQELTEENCDAIIEMLEEASDAEQHEIYRAFTVEFIDRAYAASNSAANYLAEQYGKFVLVPSFDFGYCDVLADRLTHCVQKGTLATKSICLLALLELGASHNRWYVEKRFVKYGGPDCPPSVVRRVLLDAKTNEIDIAKRLGHLTWSISINKEDLHPQFAELIDSDGHG